MKKTKKKKKKEKQQFLSNLISKMDSLAHFNSKNVNVNVHYSYSLKVMALSIFLNFWVDTNFKDLGTANKFQSFTALGKNKNFQIFFNISWLFLQWKCHH